MKFHPSFTTHPKNLFLKATFPGLLQTQCWLCVDPVCIVSTVLNPFNYNYLSSHPKKQAFLSPLYRIKKREGSRDNRGVMSWATGDSGKRSGKREESGKRIKHTRNWKRRLEGMKVGKKLNQSIWEKSDFVLQVWKFAEFVLHIPASSPWNVLFSFPGLFTLHLANTCCSFRPELRCFLQSFCWFPPPALTMAAKVLLFVFL